MRLSTLISGWVLFVCLIAGNSSAQVIDTLAIQDFELAPQTPTWSYTGVPAYFNSGFSSSTATPANSPIGIDGSRAWQVYTVGGGNTLTFSNQQIPTGYDSVRVSFRLAAMNLNSSSGGPDNLDYVLVGYSLNGGSTFTNRVRVRGAVTNNCSWPYAAGSSAEVYFTPATETVFQPANSGLQVQDGIGYVEITFPGSITQLALQITPRSSSSSDHWLVDNVVLTAENPCSPTTGSLTASTCDSYTSPGAPFIPPLAITWTPFRTAVDVIASSPST